MSLPAAPEVVGSFLVAIGQAHRLEGHPLDTRHPAIREMMKGIRRTHGTGLAKYATADLVVLRDAVSELAKIPRPRGPRARGRPGGVA